uniref:Collagen type VI alpha 6 chain n=1 Tax=Sphenodon punctatus TaxID=8508 RepID=A0A8D0G9L4_SPHPU
MKFAIQETVLVWRTPLCLVAVLGLKRKTFQVCLPWLILFRLILCCINSAESADIVLLVDGSDVLGERTFPSVKSFIYRMIGNLPVGPKRYHIALVQYSDDIHSEFQLDTFRAKNLMLNHIKKNFAYRGGALRTGNALQKVHETFFSEPTSRRDRNRVLVVVTSGLSEDNVDEPAEILRNDGIKIIAVGIQEASPEELQSMATHHFYYKLRMPRDLSMFSQNMSKIIEDNIFFVGIADLVFIVDEGLSKPKFEDMKKFLQDTISSLDVNEKCIRIGLVTYSTEPRVVSLLKTETNKSEILQKIRNLSSRPGKANTGAAISATKRNVFTESAGSRKTQAVEQIAILITHRPSEDNVSDVAHDLRKAGVTVFAIGVEGANVTQLSQIASHPKPQQQYVTKLQAFSELQYQTIIFSKKILNEIQYQLYVQAGRRHHIKTGCVDTEEADIYFLVDGSTSIQPADFQDMKSFLKEVITMFSVGADKVRFGVVQYSDKIQMPLPVPLDEYSNTNDLKKAIDNIRQIFGDTHTGKALTFMQPLFKKAQEQRSGKVPCYLIVLTDGQAQDDVKIHAESLRKEKVKVYAIGVKEAVKTQLVEIAGEESKVFYVHEFDSLKDIKNDFVSEICSEGACKDVKADIMFLVDSSGSITTENFVKMKSFMMELVNKSEIGSDQVHVGVVQFSGTSKEEFQLTKYSTKSDIISAIEIMSPLGQNTLTGDALKFVSNYFKPTKGARASVRKILILITDGEAQDEVKTPAMALREDGISVFAVGVFGANKTQLEEISGKPQLVFYVENFDILKQLESEILFGICNPFALDCKRIERLDVVFVIDGSGSIDSTEYDSMKDFMIALVKKSDVCREQVQFGAVKYAATPQTFFDLNKYDTKSAIIEAIQNDQSIGGDTYTAAAIGHSESLFTRQHGSRRDMGVPQILIVITDGVSHDAIQLNDTARRLRDNGITIYAVGIEGAKTDELLGMAGSQDKYFYVNTFGGLQNLSVPISDDLCAQSKSECNIEADVVFLIDGSNSIGDKNFAIMKNFLKELLNQIDPAGYVNIGIAQYSDKYKKELDLHPFQNRSELKGQIDNIILIQGQQTLIGSALKNVKQFFSSTRRKRSPKTRDILLVITDGESHDDVREPAESLRKADVDIYAVGVGEMNESELLQIAGSSDRKYTVENFNKLLDIKKRLTEDFCKEESDTTCWADIVMGFDISSQKQGDRLFHRQVQLENYLPVILKTLTDLKTVRCNTRTKIQFIVALSVNNTDTPVSSEFQFKTEKIMSSLKDVVIKSPSHFDVNFLQALWETFPKKSDTEKRSKVIIVFSDGLDDDIEMLEQKSDELREKGLNALITVVLEGASDFEEFEFIEFGKGFEYRTRITIGMTNIADRLSQYVVSYSEKDTCPGPRGFPGERGEKGFRGDPVSFSRRPSLSRRHVINTLYSNLLSQSVMKSEDPYVSQGMSAASSQQTTGSLVLGKQECPIHPTELVFALDVSQDTTRQAFERMREIAISIVNETKIRESNCPVGARVAVVSYSSTVHYLIRFSDAYNKNQLVQEIKNISYTRSSEGRDIGSAMRFVARNTFKRTLQGANVRKVAVFFSNGQSEDALSIHTAVLEFSALDIVPAVIALNNVPKVNRAFEMDASGQFQIVNIRQERDYKPLLQALQLCTLCYDECKPRAACQPGRPRPSQASVDAAFILDSSRTMSHVEFEKVKDFLSSVLDNFDISPQPMVGALGDRVAIVSHAPPDFRHSTQKSPVKTEFDFVTYNTKQLMKRHIKESVQQLNGVSAVGHAIQWTIDNLFPRASNARKHKAIIVISAGETSQWDKETLKNASLKAKCQGYALFVLSLGHAYDKQLEELASLPLEHHLLQLGRIHRPEYKYVVRFLKGCLHLLRNGIDSYPPENLKTRCSRISFPKGKRYM